MVEGSQYLGFECVQTDLFVNVGTERAHVPKATLLLQNYLGRGGVFAPVASYNTVCRTSYSIL